MKEAISMIQMSFRQTKIHANTKLNSLKSQSPRKTYPTTAQASNQFVQYRGKSYRLCRPMMQRSPKSTNPP